MAKHTWTPLNTFKGSITGIFNLKFVYDLGFGISMVIMINYHMACQHLESVYAVT